MHFEAMKRGRPPKSFKLASITKKPLLSVETSRELRLGDIDEVVFQIHELLGHLEKNPDALARYQEWLAKFLVGVFRRRDGKRLRDLADLIEGKSPGNKLAAALIKLVCRHMVVGDRWQDVAARLPESEILEGLERLYGVKAIWPTVRSTLNKLGVKRPRGRPSKKMRDC